MTKMKKKRRIANSCTPLGDSRFKQRVMKEKVEEEVVSIKEN